MNFKFQSGLEIIPITLLGIWVYSLASEPAGIAIIFGGLVFAIARQNLMSGTHA